MGRRNFNKLRTGVSPDALATAAAELQDRVARTATSLADLRGRRALTQVQVAERLDRTQSQVSRVENGQDPHVSTLAEYVDALGGTLELVARFDDGSELLIALESAEQALMPGTPESSGLAEASMALTDTVKDSLSAEREEGLVIEKVVMSTKTSSDRRTGTKSADRASATGR